MSGPSYVDVGYEWRPIQLSEGPAIQLRMDLLLEEWRGTRYMSGQDVKGEAADCLRFVSHVLDDLFRTERRQALRTISDASCMHDARAAQDTVDAMREVYDPNERVRDRFIEPGDLVVTGPGQGGPGHVMIVGPRPNTIWHCNRGIGVQVSGMALPDEQVIKRVYRLGGRKQWWR